MHLSTERNLSGVHILSSGWIALGAVLLLSASVSPLAMGCATFVHGTKQEISVGSIPDGAAVYVDDEESGVTPLTVTLDRRETRAVRIEKPGYEPHRANLSREASAWVIGNIVFGRPIGLVVGGLIDAGSGGFYTLHPAKVEAVLSKQGR